MKKTEKVFCSICLAILMFFFCTIIIRTVTRQVLVKHLGINNVFTNVVLFDVQNINDGTNLGDGNGSGFDEELHTTASVKVDWTALYPFSEEVLEEKAVEEKAERVDKLTSTIALLEGNVETYTSNYLLGHKKLIEAANAYENVIKWNYAPYSEYNGVITTSDGYLTSFYALSDVSEIANATISLAHFCRENNTPFIYVNTPFKVCEYDDIDISGVTDFTNQNVNSFIDQLEDYGIDYFDLRKQLHAERLIHHELFFRTDHHWTPESGLWAARTIADLLNAEYGFNFDVSLIEDVQFTSVLYPNWFLGSQGKKVTLSNTEPDDICLLYPNYPTKLHFELKTRGINTDGDFSILYNMKQIDECDYYNRSPYHTYSYGDQALERIENKLVDNGNRLLLVHDSFGDCVIPFLSLGCQYLDAIDLRYFDGSLQSFILQEKPDAVVILYNPSQTRYSKVESGGLFDFR